MLNCIISYRVRFSFHMLGVLMWDMFDDARFQVLQLVNIGDQYTANQHSKMGLDGFHNILCWKNVSKLELFCVSYISFSIQIHVNHFILHSKLVGPVKTSVCVLFILDSGPNFKVNVITNNPR